LMHVPSSPDTSSGSDYDSDEDEFLFSDASAGSSYHDNFISDPNQWPDYFHTVRYTSSPYFIILVSSSSSSKSRSQKTKKSSTRKSSSAFFLSAPSPEQLPQLSSELISQNPNLGSAMHTLQEKLNKLQLQQTRASEETLIDDVEDEEQHKEEVDERYERAVQFAKMHSSGNRLSEGLQQVLATLE